MAQVMLRVGTAVLIIHAYCFPMYKVFCVMKGWGLELPKIIVPVFYLILPMETELSL